MLRGGVLLAALSWGVGAQQPGDNYVVLRTLTKCSFEHRVISFA
eukprot:COSAG02_NODE_2674_length_8282_cov_200.926922_8_plen_44_part_00